MITRRLTFKQRLEALIFGCVTLPVESDADKCVAALMRAAIQTVDRNTNVIGKGKLFRTEQDWIDHQIEVWMNPESDPHALAAQAQSILDDLNAPKTRPIPAKPTPSIPKEFPKFPTKPRMK